MLERISKVSVIHHVAIVLALLAFLSTVECYRLLHPALYLLCFFYLFLVHERYTIRLRRRLQFEANKQAAQRRLLSDSESVQWLNHAVATVWPICMENIASQKFLLPIIPWFLDKFKPWTARKAVVQQLYLGKKPPMFTDMRVLGRSTDDDHLVLELGMNFLADDMSAVLAVKLRKRLGFGIWTKMHITGMHVEGKILVGVKFLQHWPFLGRVRLSFIGPPYFQMTVKPIFNRGLDVTELPGIAGWLDKLLSVAFEQTLVEPNMLVVDVAKFVSSPTEPWFEMNEKPPIAYIKVEIIEGADMKPADMNGFSDPYVKGQLGPYRFRTKIQWKTLTPKWLEEFMIPVISWDASTTLVLEVRDKDRIFDDTLGDCIVDISEMRGGQRYDRWLPLKNIKMGRLHLAVTIVEAEDEKIKQSKKDNISQNMEDIETSRQADENHISSKPSMGIKISEENEPIPIEGLEKPGIWVHRPGTDSVPQIWESRKGKVRQGSHKQCQSEENIDSPGSAVYQRSETNNSEDSPEGKNRMRNKIRQAAGSVKRAVGSAVYKKSKDEIANSDEKVDVVLTPRANIRAVGDKRVGINLVVDNVNGGEFLSELQQNNVASLEKGKNISPDMGMGMDMDMDEVEEPKVSIFKKAENAVSSFKKSFKRRKGGKEGFDDKDSEATSSSDSLPPSPMVVKSVQKKSGYDNKPVLQRVEGRSMENIKGESTVSPSTINEEPASTVKNVSFKGEQQQTEFQEAA